MHLGPGPGPGPGLIRLFELLLQPGFAPVLHQLVYWDLFAPGDCVRESHEDVCGFMSVLLQVHTLSVSSLSLLSVFFHLSLCHCMCVCVRAPVVSFSVSVCVCALCSQPLCGKQSLWRALAFRTQSWAPLHPPAALPRIQPWTHATPVRRFSSLAHPSAACFACCRPERPDWGRCSRRTLLLPAAAKESSAAQLLDETAFAGVLRHSHL